MSWDLNQTYNITITSQNVTGRTGWAYFKYSIDFPTYTWPGHHSYTGADLGFSLGTLNNTTPLAINMVGFNNTTFITGMVNLAWPYVVTNNISANFTSNTTYGPSPTNISFTDTTVPTPDKWWWWFGDGNTSTLRNPTHVYYTGLYNVSLTVQYNGLNSTNFTQTGYIRINQTPSCNFTSNVTEGLTPLSVQFNDTSTNSPTMWNWSFGDGTANASTQNPVHQFVNVGYYNVTLTAGNAIGNGTTIVKTEYIHVTYNQEQSALPGGYAPHNVRFYFIDQNGVPIKNMAVTAVPNGQSTSPTSWLYQIFGYNETGVDLPHTSLAGTTGNDGSISFYMSEILQYTVTVSPTGGGTQSISVYPKDTDYWVTVNLAPKPGLALKPSFYLNATNSSDNSNITMSFSYSDPGATTTALNFYVINDGSIIHTQSWGPGTSTATSSHTVTNTKGETYTFGFNGTNAYGNSSSWRDITTKGSSVLVDLGLDANTYMMISFMIIVLFASMFGVTSIKQGAFLVPFLGAGMFWYIGWLPVGMGGLICFLSFLGALYYMRAQERKTLGGE
jgi:PKD repeat protein